MDAASPAQDLRSRPGWLEHGRPPGTPRRWREDSFPASDDLHQLVHFLPLVQSAGADLQLHPDGRGEIQVGQVVRNQGIKCSAGSLERDARM